MNERKLKMQPPIWAAFKCVNSINSIQVSIYPYLWLMHVLYKSILTWFWIEGNGHFLDFLTCVPLCCKNLSVQCRKRTEVRTQGIEDPFKQK